MEVQTGRGSKKFVPDLKTKMASLPTFRNVSNTFIDTVVQFRSIKVALQFKRMVNGNQIEMSNFRDRRYSREIAGIPYREKCPPV